MAIFGAPIPHEDHALPAVRMAVDMQARVAEVPFVHTEARKERERQEALEKREYAVALADAEAVAQGRRPSTCSILGRDSNTTRPTISRLRASSLSRVSSGVCQ